jgi:hypothetical protein
MYSSLIIHLSLSLFLSLDTKLLKYLPQYIEWLNVLLLPEKVGDESLFFANRHDLMNAISSRRLLQLNRYDCL